MWFFLSNFRIKNKHFFACMQILTNQRIISWKKQMVSNLIRKITCSSWDNESIQSRQIYDVIILVHQTEIGTFLSTVHVGHGVSGAVSLLWLAFYSPPTHWGQLYLSANCNSVFSKVVTKTSWFWTLKCVIYLNLVKLSLKLVYIMKKNTFVMCQTY
jgi:hypothetical protein